MIKYGYIKTVAADLFRYMRKKSFFAFVYAYSLFPGFRYIFWMRTTYELRRHTFLRLFHYVSRFILYRLSIKFGLDIPYNTSIKPGFYIGHFGNIVVHH